MKKTPLGLIVLLSLVFIFHENVLAQNDNLIWANQVSSTSWLYGPGTIAKDDAGNIYSIGYFNGTSDLDPGPGQFNLTTLTSSINAYILKLNSDGKFIWAKRFEGLDSSGSVIKNIVINNSGELILTGTFTRIVDFDPSLNSFNLTSNGLEDIFIAKLDSNGTFKWAKQIGGKKNDFGSGISIDNNQNILFTGAFQDTVDFNPGLGLDVHIAADTQSSDLLILKLNSAGNYIWGKKIGSQGTDRGHSVATDKNGNIFTTGVFSKTDIDYDPGPGIVTFPQTFGQSLIIHKLDPNGNLSWVKQMPSPSVYSIMSPYCIKLDAEENIYTTGTFRGLIDFDPGVDTFYLSSTATHRNIFISKLNNQGDFVWAKIIESSGTPGLSSQWGSSIDFDPAGNLYTIGTMMDTLDFDPGPGIYNIYPKSRLNAYILKLDTAGNLVWAHGFGNNTALGINSGASGVSLVVDEHSNVIANGVFDKTVDFDPKLAVYNLTNNHAGVYILKLGNFPTSTKNIVQNSNQEVVIYPNPHTGQFKINASNDLSINIIDGLGKSVYTNNLKKGISSIDLSQVAAGIYFAQINYNDDNHIQTVKIIKEQ